MSGHEDVNYLKASSGLRNWLITLDHKRIGIMYLISVSIAFIAGGIFALLLRTELIAPGKTLVDADTYNQLFTLHGAIMVFLFIIPSIPAAFGNFFLPIMLGAKDVAFPRLNLMSFYIYTLGAVLALSGIVLGNVDTGWTFYTPYSSGAFADSSVFWMTAAVFVMGFSSILTGVNFIATVHTMRAPGLNWKRLSLFIWGIYATSVIQVLATPVLAITLMLLFMEKAMGIGIFDPTIGGDPVLFQHFFWFYSHPAVYIMILPGMAVVNELIATFSQRKIFGYMFVAMSSVSLALIGFLVWGHHMFTSGMSEYAAMVFSALTFLVAIPSGVKVFNWVATLYQGSIRLATPMLYGLSFIVLFSIGGLTGLFLGTLSVDIHLHDTYFVVAHFHYVMVGGTVIGFFGGLHYWWPKMTGKMYDEKLGVISWFFVFVGFNLTFFPQFIMGSQGMPRRYYDYLDQYTGFHQASTVGAYLLGVGVLIMTVMFAKSLLSGKPAPENPWGSAGYEWLTATPPVFHNFVEQPIIERGPYDYHLCSDRELYEGFHSELPDEDTESASGAEDDWESEKPTGVMSKGRVEQELKKGGDNE